MTTNWLFNIVAIGAVVWFLVWFWRNDMPWHHKRGGGR